MSVALPELVVAEDAIEQLAAGAARDRWPAALLVADQNTRDALGARLADVLRARGVNVREVVFPQRTGLLADHPAVDRTRAALDGASLPVAVGAGVITDIVRYAAHLEQRDFLSVPTAASMDGYASSVAALQVDGVKVTYPARAPTAVFADPGVAAAAPPDLTRAGIGDLLAKATARVDWLAAHLLYGEPFSENVAERVLAPLTFAVMNAQRVVTGESDAIRALLDGLLQSGIAMAIAGSSRPASGCEHHASHFWDLLAARGRRDHASHGLQVGYATRFAARLQRFAFGGEGVPRLRPPTPVVDPLGPAAREWLGAPSDEIVDAVREKERFIERSRAAWPADDERWAAVRARLGPAMEVFGAVERALDVAQIPASPGYLEIDADTLDATFRYASRLRARYTVIDFLEGQGALDRGIEEALR